LTALKNPEEATELMRKAFPEMDPEVMRALASDGSAAPGVAGQPAPWEAEGG
jgi:hypothetical protein